jgi:ankyrin repeat protein
MYFMEVFMNIFFKSLTLSLLLIPFVSKGMRVDDYDIDGWGTWSASAIEAVEARKIKGELLIEAIQANNSDLVSEILLHISPNVLDTCHYRVAGKLPDPDVIHLAIMKQSLPILKLLVNKGANMYGFYQSEDVVAHAVTIGSLPIVKYLLDEAHFDFNRVPWESATLENAIRIAKNNGYKHIEDFLSIKSKKN